VNEAAAAMFGSSAETIVGHRCFHYLCPGLEGACPVYNCGMGVKNLERTLVCADGSRLPILKSVNKITIHGKERMLECFMDISERERAQAALRETNRKLNLLGSITRHDINNQLMALTGYLELMEKGQNESLHGQYLRKAGSAAKNISAMIQFTKTYEDIGIQAPTWQRTHEIVENCAKDVHLGEMMIVNEIPHESEIFVDPMISKVFLNLIQNSKSHGGGVTTIRFSVEERNGVRAIVCEDNGVGIPTVMKEKLFSKGFGNGHGFGLFLSREILAITGIMINEEGEPGKGARFVLTLPKDGFRAN
jgi:signal transduction histidine kinase